MPKYEPREHVIDTELANGNPDAWRQALGFPRRSMRRHQVDDGDCVYCDREKAAANTFHPPHDASENCQSGKHPHCSCDTCF